MIEHKVVNLDKELKVGDRVQIVYGGNGRGSVKDAPLDKSQGIER
jgi:hypothetical protein